MSANVQAVLSDFTLGKKNLEQTAALLDLYQKGASSPEEDAKRLAEIRTEVRRLYRLGLLDRGAAKLLGKWTTDYSGFAGELESIPIIGWIFRLILNLLSAIPVVGAPIRNLRNF